MQKAILHGKVTDNCVSSCLSKRTNTTFQEEQVGQQRIPGLIVDIITGYKTGYYTDLFE